MKITRVIAHLVEERVKPFTWQVDRPGSGDGADVVAQLVHRQLVAAQQYGVRVGGIGGDRIFIGGEAVQTGCGNSVVGSNFVHGGDFCGYFGVKRSRAR